MLSGKQALTRRVADVHELLEHAQRGTGRTVGHRTAPPVPSTVVPEPVPAVEAFRVRAWRVPTSGAGGTSRSTATTTSARREPPELHQTAAPQIAIRHRQQVLDHPGADLGLNQVDRPPSIQDRQFPVEPEVGLAGVGERLFGKRPHPREPDRAVGLLHRQPASLGAAVRQRAGLDDEGRDVALRDTPLPQRVDRGGREPQFHRSGQLGIRPDSTADGAAPAELLGSEEGRRLGRTVASGSESGICPSSTNPNPRQPLRAPASSRCGGAEPGLAGTLSTMPAPGQSGSPTRPRCGRAEWLDTHTDK